MAKTHDVDVPQHVLDYLGAQPTLTLATVSGGAVPRATTLTYVNEGATVYVWTRPEATSARQMQENPVVSLAIDEYTPDWRDAKGIQATCKARVVLNPAELSRVGELFAKKYPALADVIDTDVSVFRITPTELQFIDNTQDAESQGGRVSYRRDLVYSVFHDLPREELATVAAKLRTMKVAAGEVVVRQGAPADKFFIIVDGEVEVLR